MIDMKSLLQELAESKLVKITGSWADGSQSETSDYDFKLKESKQDIYGDDILPRPIDTIKGICEKYGVKFKSSFPGSMHTHLVSGNGYLQTSMEFSEHFNPRKNKLKEVEILGVKFKTY